MIQHHVSIFPVAYPEKSTIIRSYPRSDSIVNCYLHEQFAAALSTDLIICWILLLVELHLYIQHNMVFSN